MIDRAGLPCDVAIGAAGEYHVAHVTLESGNGLAVVIDGGGAARAEHNEQDEKGET